MLNKTKDECKTYVNMNIKVLFLSKTKQLKD